MPRLPPTEGGRRMEDRSIPSLADSAGPVAPRIPPTPVPSVCPLPGPAGAHTPPRASGYPTSPDEQPRKSDTQVQLAWRDAMAQLVSPDMTEVGCPVKHSSLVDHPSCPLCIAQRRGRLPACALVDPCMRDVADLAWTQTTFPALWSAIIVAS